MSRKPTAASTPRSRCSWPVCSSAVRRTSFATPATVPVKFTVDNHPRIRARVLHAQGEAATQIAAALVSEFHVNGFDAPLILHAETFTSVDIATAAQVVFGADPDQTTAWLRDANIPT